MRRFAKSSALASALLGASVAVAACSQPSATSGASGPGPAASSHGTPSATPTANCPSGAWQAAPLSVARQVAVPPVPVVTAVRAAQHPECRYDRIVFDVRGALPAYSIRFVRKLAVDPSGRHITVPGRHILVISLRPAQAHTSGGAPTFSAAVHRLSFPVLASWVRIGDFEGTTSVAIGLNKMARIRVGELPGHLYVDIQE